GVPRAQFLEVGTAGGGRDRGARTGSEAITAAGAGLSRAGADPFTPRRRAADFARRAVAELGHELRLSERSSRKRHLPSRLLKRRQFPCRGSAHAIDLPVLFFHEGGVPGVCLGARHVEHQASRLISGSIPAVPDESRRLRPTLKGKGSVRAAWLTKV